MEQNSVPGCATLGKAFDIPHLQSKGSDIHPRGWQGSPDPIRLSQQRGGILSSWLLHSLVSAWGWRFILTHWVTGTGDHISFVGREIVSDPLSRKSSLFSAFSSLGQLFCFSGNRPLIPMPWLLAVHCHHFMSHSTNNYRKPPSRDRLFKAISLTKAMLVLWRLSRNEKDIFFNVSICPC